MSKKTTKRTSVWAALVLAFAMLLTAFAFVAGSPASYAFADDNEGKLLYIVDAGRVNDQSGKQLPYGYTQEKTPVYVNSTKTFIKRNGGTFGDITEDNGNPLTLLCNSYTDRPFAEDPSTHKYWGFNENYTTDMPHRMGRAGEWDAGYSEFRSVNDSTVTTERLVYKFEVPEDAALAVTVFTRAPSGWGTVNGKMSVNGGAAFDLVANDANQTRAINDCKGILDNKDGRYYLTLTFGEDGAKTVINGIIIREKPKTFNVTYNLDGGTNNVANKTSYTYGAGLTLADPTRTGYTFDGWYDAATGGNKVTAISNTDTGDVTLYARWTATTYSITYNLDGGTNNAANGTSYTYGAGLTLADPTREGYTFDGWYDAATGGNKVTAISDTDTGDVTLYARWTKNAAAEKPESETEKDGGCKSSIGGTAALVCGLLLLSAGTVVICKRKSKH